MLLPMTAGEIVLSYNLPASRHSGCRAARTSTSSWVRSPSGTIRRSSRPIPASSSPLRTSPSWPAPDSSGTTSTCLPATPVRSAKNSKSTVGHGKTAQWPKSFVKAPKNDGVTATIKQTPAPSVTSNTATRSPPSSRWRSLQNKAGKFVAPGDESVRPPWPAPSFRPTCCGSDTPICASGFLIPPASKLTRSPPSPDAVL